VAASRQHALRPTRTINNTDSSSIGGGVVKIENTFGEVDGGSAVLVACDISSSSMAAGRLWLAAEGRSSFSGRRFSSEV